MSVHAHVHVRAHVRMYVRVHVRMYVRVHVRMYVHMYYPGQKKRTIHKIRGEKNAVPRVISCSIRRDQRRAKVADSRGLDLPCADCA